MQTRYFLFSIPKETYHGLEPIKEIMVKIKLAIKEFYQSWTDFRDLSNSLKKNRKQTRGKRLKECVKPISRRLLEQESNI